MIAIVVCFSISGIVNIILMLLCVRATKKLLALDDMYEMMDHEIDVNARYFDKLLATPLLNNCQEIREAHRNMHIMSIRLREYAERISELTGKKTEE